MKNILLQIILSSNILIGQVDSAYRIGEINNTNVTNTSKVANLTIYYNSEDRSEPTLLKANYNGKDTIYELVYDVTYKGTAKELSEGIQSGAIEKYYVLEKDGKLYERIKPVIFEESFFEKYWIYFGIIILIIGTFYYKLYSKNNHIGLDEEVNSEEVE